MFNTRIESDTGRSSRLHSIDVLRACAALSVVFVSIGMYGPHGRFSQAWLPEVYRVLALGHGVPLFFVISGFCIHLRWAKQYAERGKTGVDFWGFWRRRLFRLYPPYLVMLCVCMAVVVLALLRGWQFSVAEYYPHPRLWWAGIDFLLHALMLHGLSPRFDFTGGNDPFWSLAREEYLYLMYFALLSWRRALGTLKAVAIALALSIAIPWGIKLLAPPFHSTTWWLADPWYPVNTLNSALVLWMQWALGMVAVEAYYGLVTLPRWCYWRWVSAVCGVAGLLCEQFNVPVISPLIWGVTFFILVNFCVAREQTQRWPQHHILRWLANVGIFSYSLYLTHTPAMSLLSKIEPIIRARVGVTVITPLYFACAYVLMFIFAYYCGKVFFLLVERHFLHSRVAKDTQAITGRRPNSTAAINK